MDSFPHGPANLSHSFLQMYLGKTECDGSSHLCQVNYIQNEPKPKQLGMPVWIFLAGFYDVGRPVLNLSPSI